MLTRIVYVFVFVLVCNGFVYGFETNSLFFVCLAFQVPKGLSDVVASVEFAVKECFGLNPNQFCVLFELYEAICLLVFSVIVDVDIVDRATCIIVVYHVYVVCRNVCFVHIVVDECLVISPGHFDIPYTSTFSTNCTMP